MREELVLEALKKAIEVRTVEKEMILHSDRGGSRLAMPLEDYSTSTSCFRA